jgi:hypothetical protein
MTEFDREFFKTDPVFHKLYMIIKEHHKVAKHTEKTLYEGRHIPDFCEEARHFTELPGLKPIYIHYDVASWWKEPAGVQVRIESIGVYDNFMEYETARMRGLHSGKEADIPNIN